jgi:iron(III) transport system substrate-binding protein
MADVLRIRKILACAGAAALAVLLAACGGSGGAASGPAGPKPLSPSRLIAGAKKEGTVTWYTTFSSDDVSPMIAAFNKDYPGIKVQALRLSADQLPPKVMTEQRGQKFNADVITGDAIPMSQLLHAGALAPYDAPSEPPLPSSLSLPAGYRGVVYVVTTVIAYNPAALKSHGLKPPATVADLAKPQWRGQFSVDPGAVNWYESLIAALGHAKALSLVKAIGNNSPRIVTSHTQALTQVASGEPLATTNAYGYKASSLKKKTPDQIEFINPTPLPASLTLADLGKNAPHPSAARLFLDWLMSRQGQQQVVGVTNHTSLEPGTGNDTAVWDPAKWTPAWAEPDVAPGKYNQYASEYRSALHAG